MEAGTLLYIIFANLLHYNNSLRNRRNSARCVQQPFKITRIFALCCKQQILGQITNSFACRKAFGFTFKGASALTPDERLSRSPKNPLELCP